MSGNVESKDPMTEEIATTIADDFKEKGSVFTLYQFYWQWKADCHFV